MSFSPPLGQQIVIPSTPGHLNSLHFSYTPTPQLDDARAEVWTNLPSGEWHEVPFSRLNLTIYTAQIDVSALGSYEWTYRLVWKSGGVSWCGGEGGNGKVIIVDSPPAYEGDAFEFTNTATSAVEGKGRGVKLVSFALDPNESSRDFELGDLKQGSEWSGMTLEQSERTWFCPRLLHLSHNPIHQVSTKYIAQMVILRSQANTASPTSKQIVILPFSTTSVSSSLIQISGKLAVRAQETVATSNVTDRHAYCVIVEGSEGHLKGLVEKAVKVATEVVTSSVVPSSATSDTSSSVPESVATASSFGNPSSPHLAPYGLTYCTWISLGQEYRLSQVLECLDDFVLRQNADGKELFGKSLNSIMLDDGWQDVVKYQEPEDTDHQEKRGLFSFGTSESWYDLTLPEADQEGEGKTKMSSLPGSRIGHRQRQDSGYSPSDGDLAPETTRRAAELADAVRQIKERGVERVGVWMTLHGYWEGLNPHSPLGKHYSVVPVKIAFFENDKFNTATHYLPSTSSLDAYYLDYFTSLRNAGVDFVKVDNQAQIDYIVTKPDADVPGKQDFLRAMRLGVDKVFGPSNIVHCMAGSPLLWGGDLAFSNSSTKGIIRNSDDYFPFRDGSHTAHIWLNSHSTLLTRSLNFLPDFDMAQEKHPYGPFHIAFRAFATAPVYATDEKGSLASGTSARGWEGLLGETKTGQVKVIQARDEAGTVLEGRLGEDGLGSGEGSAVKVAFSTGATGSVLGIFNCRAGDAVSVDCIDKKDVADALGPYAVADSYVLKLGGAQDIIQVDAKGLEALSSKARVLAKPLVGIRLDPKDFGIATIAPTFALPSLKVDSKQVQIACLGLDGKHAPLVPVQSVTLLGKNTPPPLLVISEPSSGLTARRPLARQPSSNFPTPPVQSRSAFLLTCFLGYRSFLPHQKNADGSPRTTQSESHLLAADFVRSPFATLWTELRTFIAFGLLLVVWRMGHLPIFRGNMTSSTPTMIESAPSSDCEEVEIDVAGPTFRVQLDYSGELLFFVATEGDAAKDTVQVKIDGRVVEQDFVERTSIGNGVLIKVDVAGWQKEQTDKPKGKKWVVDVTC